jgi:hypothetical protein
MGKETHAHSSKRTFPLHKSGTKLQLLHILISNFRRVLYVVGFLLGNSPASEFLYADVLEHSVCSIFMPMKMEQSVPIRRNIKFRRRGITYKKTQNNCYILSFLKQNFYFNFTESYGSVISSLVSYLGDLNLFLSTQPPNLIGIGKFFLLLQENAGIIPQLWPRQLRATNIDSPVSIIVFVNVIHCCTNIKLL